MKNKILLLLVLLTTSIVQNAFAQEIQEQTIQVQKLKTFTQKGTKLFVQCNCWDDNQFKQDLLTQLGGKGIWRIVNNANEADFILHVNAWFRPQVEMNWYDAYVLVFDNSDHLLYKSDLYTGLPTFSFAPVEAFRKATAKKLINDGLLKEIPKSKWIYSEPLDLFGYCKISEDKYKASENYFRQGIDYFNQYNYKEAIKMFSIALSINPYNAFTYEFRAISFYNLTKYGDAKKDIIAAMKLDPINKQNDTIYYNIMVGKNNKFMKTWGPGGTMDKINGVISSVNQVINTNASPKIAESKGPNQNYNNISYSNGRSSVNYQAQYDIWVNNARSNYTTLYNAKDRSSSTTNDALIIQTKRYLAQAQSNMRRIRSEASSNGVTISPSEYESISY